MWSALLLLAAANLASAAFTNPLEHSRSVWTLGDKETIKYGNIDWESYNIALWQQALAGGSAKLGPIVYQTSSGPSSSFDWVVQLYDFDLTDSNIFFFWMFQGDPSNQGNPKLPNMVSSYFNITKADTTTSSASSSSATSTAATKSSSHPKPTPHAPTKPANASPTAPSTPTNSPQSSGGGGLSTGAQAGIGVGVGIAGVAAIIAGIFWIRHRRRKTATAPVELQSESAYPPTYGPDAWKAQQAHYSPPPAELHSSPPVELHSDPRSEPAELG